MDQPPAVAFTAFADVWPTRNGDSRRSMRHWRGRNLEIFFCDLLAKHPKQIKLSFKD